MVCLNCYQQTRGFSRKLFRSWYNRVTETARGIPPYNHIAQVGDPVLRSQSVKVPRELFGSTELKCLVKQLKHVSDNYECVGLSAPQIGIDLRVFIAEFNANHAKSYSEKQFETRAMSLVPFTIFINPELKVTDVTKVIFNEGCESVKGFHADVPRYSSVEIRAFDEDGKQFTRAYSGWAARIVQHEMDHLNGVVYTDIMDRKTFTCNVWTQVNKHNGRIELPFRP